MDIVSYIIYSVSALFFAVIVFTIYIVFLRATPKIHLLKKVGGKYQLVKIIKFKMSDTEVKYKNKTYLLDLDNNGVNWKRNKPHLYNDIDDCTALTFNEGQKYNAEMLQTLIDNHMLKGIFGKEQEKLLIIIILILVLCLMISVSFNIYVTSNPAAFLPPPSNATLPVSNISPIV